MIWIQPPFKPDSTRLISSKAVVAVLLLPQVAAERVERHAEAVADAVGEDLLDVVADLAADGRARGEERVVGRRRAVVVQPQDHAGEVRVVRLGAAPMNVPRGLSQARSPAG